MKIIIKPSVLLFFTLLATGCGDVFTESLDPKNNFPLTALIPPPYYASGVLDMSFGAGGVATAFASPESEESLASSIVTDGSCIYLAGRITHIGHPTNMALWRYNADGSPDVDFGDSACIRTVGSAMGGDMGYSDEGNAMTISNDGMIYIAGGSIREFETDHGLVGNYRIIIWRYNPSSQKTGLQVFAIFDPYGSSGAYINENAYGIKADNNGRVIVTGYVDSYMAILCYNRYGVLDNSFGSNGVMGFDGSLGGTAPYDSAWGFDLTLDSRGRVLIAGGVHISGSWGWFNDMALWRLTKEGMPDISFGQNCQVTHDGAARNGNSGGVDCGHNVIVDQQDRILVLGRSTDERDINKVVIWCYKDNGELDPEFGNGGIVIVGDIPSDPYRGEGAGDMTLDARGKIVITGGYSSGMALWRFNPDGTPDETFGNKGVVLYPATYETLNLTGGNSVTINDGRIFVGGASGYDKSIMTIWKYK